MKECAICGEQLDDHALGCSKGHHLFKPKRGKQMFSNEQIIEDMLRQSSVGYTEEEIAYLVGAIAAICQDARTPITRELIDTIAEKTKEKHRQRQEAERQQREETERRQRQQREETECRQRQQREETERRQRRQREEMENRQRERERLLRMDIERALPLFRGFNDRFVSPNDLVQLLADALNVSLYTRLQNQQPTACVDRTYDNNQTFWNDALNGVLVQGMRIQLNHFHLTEWIPSAPGRYFTPDAIQARERAKRFLDYERREYLPLGKAEMVLGGVGSIRLGAKHIGSDEVYPLCASSSGISHQGIPVIVTEHEYRKVMYLIRDAGGCLANISGHLRITRKEELPINYDTQIRRYSLFVNDIEVLGAPEQLLATVAITFSGNNRLDHKLWSFCSFDPTRQNVNEAVTWLKNYTLRYSHTHHPFILGDFDEHYQHFDNPIEFPLAQVLRGQIDYGRLSEYQQALPYNITINIGEYAMVKQDFRGSWFTSLGGQQLVGVIEKTIVNLNASGWQELGNALAELTSAVEASSHLSDEQKLENLETIKQLGEEAAKPKPNKSHLKDLGDRLMSALQAVPDVAKMITSLAPLLEKLLT